MKKFTAEQIVRLRQEAETGTPVRDVCREHNVAEQTFYCRRKRYADTDVSDGKAMKVLQNENIA